MDLSTMQAKAEARQYANLSEFFEDYSLMIQNCHRYNEPKSWYHNAGSQMKGRMKKMQEKTFNKEIADVIEDLRKVNAIRVG
jgi:flagellum-specific peptidoglycan hydrolase FlgJ